MGMKKALPTLVFYGVAFILLWFLASDPGGPCAPNPLIFLWLVLPFLSVFLLIKNLHFPFDKSKRNTIAALIHAVVILLFVGYFIIISNFQ